MTIDNSEVRSIKIAVFILLLFALSVLLTQLTADDESDSQSESPTVTEETPTPAGTPVYLPLTFEVEDWHLAIRQVERLTMVGAEAESAEPQNGAFLILIGELTNKTDIVQCTMPDMFVAYDRTHDREHEYETGIERLLKDRFDGYTYTVVQGICANPGRSRQVFIPFDVDPSSELVLRFLEDDGAEPIDVGAAQSLARAVTVTPTMTATPTNTPTPTRPPTITPTPPGMLTVIGTANLRGGPGLVYPVIDQVEYGEVFGVFARTPDGWLQIDAAGSLWIASSLVSLQINWNELPLADTVPPTPTATATPTHTSTPDVTATGRVLAQDTTATARRRAAADATATLEALARIPPQGAWCEQNAAREVCVGDFRYTRSAGYTSAATNARFIAFGMRIRNRSGSDIVVSPLDVTLVLEDGRTYAYDASTFSYWAQPLDVVTLSPGGIAEGGLVFYVRNDIAPRYVIYRGFFESDVEIDLFD